MTKAGECVCSLFSGQQFNPSVEPRFWAAHFVVYDFPNSLYSSEDTRDRNDGNGHISAGRSRAAERPFPRSSRNRIKFSSKPTFS